MKSYKHHHEQVKKKHHSDIPENIPKTSLQNWEQDKNNTYQNAATTAMST